VTDVYFLKIEDTAGLTLPLEYGNTVSSRNGSSSSSSYVSTTVRKQIVDHLTLPTFTDVSVHIFWYE
jgi:hypothetical protein